MGELKGFCAFFFLSLSTFGFIWSLAAQPAETDGHVCSGIHVFSLNPAHHYDAVAKQIS